MSIETASWARDLRALPPGECARLDHPEPWGVGVALALAPHPDDPDAVAVTLRLLVERGWEMHWAIVTSGWSGVRDDFVGPDPDAKARARMAEQRDSARLFGLPEDGLTFLGLTESATGEMERTSANHERFIAALDSIAPNLVILPHRHDSNATHRLVYEWFESWAEAWHGPVVALANEDPKTQDFHPNVQVVFDELRAQWKGTLLECHRSQSARNVATRGITFAERILSVNQVAPGTYSERFEAASWRV